MIEMNICLEGKNILVTGCAGFIGSNLVKKLFKETGLCRIVGFDNINDYYDVSLKRHRLSGLERLAKDYSGTYEFVLGDLSDKELLLSLFEKYHFDLVVNLAAQAGVRYSITNPDIYIESNIIGFYNILQACREYPVQHLVYASSSSVYGANTKVPFSTEDKTDNPVSLYAATKKSNELLAYVYSSLYKIPATGLRFFTVYGPEGRPDMAYYGFTDKLIKGQTINIFNYGNCKRDFTYIDDIVDGVFLVMQGAPQGSVPNRLYNIGNNQPENLLSFVQILSEELVRAKILPEDYDFDAHKELVPMQSGDVEVTYADISALQKDFNFRPSTSLREGLRKFVQWYKVYYNL